MPGFAGAYVLSLEKEKPGASSEVNECSLYIARALAIAYSRRRFSGPLSELPSTVCFDQGRKPKKAYFEGQLMSGLSPVVYVTCL